MSVTSFSVLAVCIAPRYDHTMSEEPESENMTLRPRWREIEWHGWNLLALGWMFMGFVVGFVTGFVCSVFTPWLRNEQLHGTVAIAVGVSVVIADVICRTRDPETKGWRRYVSPSAGGAVLFVPAWFIALWIIGTGVLTALGKA
jgi:hypothetical protein